jgi:biopolymer transport protein TolQ
MSFFHLIVGASAVVQLVMLLLLAVSMASWTMIFRRRSALIEAREAADDFEDRFWSGGELSALYRDISASGEHAIGMAGIFRAGFSEFADRRPRNEPVFSCHGWFHQPLCRPVRDRVGYHEFVSRAG